MNWSNVLLFKKTKNLEQISSWTSNFKISGDIVRNGGDFIDEQIFEMFRRSFETVMNFRTLLGFIFCKDAISNDILILHVINIKQYTS